MAQQRIYQDPSSTTHQSNRERNDFLADILTQLNPDRDIDKIKRVDQSSEHCWVIYFN